jgi:hypothetical protein
MALWAHRSGSSFSFLYCYRCFAGLAEAGFPRVLSKKYQVSPVCYFDGSGI